MFEVLKNKQQIQDARDAMRRDERSAIEEGAWAKISRRVGLSSGLPVGDFVKSWDVAATLDFIAEHVPKNAHILDLGAYCSEVPVALARMGYTGVYGVDLNPRVKEMPHSDSVSYSVSDFMSTPFEASTFSAVTAISVIEHGYDPNGLFCEVGRLLRPAGYFLASFDYWPEKINTGNTKFFDMSWRIFSFPEVEEMIEIAKRYGLHPAGALHPESGDRAISCVGYDYTFGWIVLQKRL